MRKEIKVTTMDGKQKLKKYLQKFADEISPEYSLDSLYLFGSQAWGKPRKDSDVDLLVVSKGFHGKRKLQRAPPLYMKWNLNYPVDFICLTPQEFNKKKKEISIVQEVIERGIRIV